nr:MAG TPA: hypothetical protein [Caudoviricetes sp.]
MIVFRRMVEGNSRKLLTFKRVSFPCLTIHYVLVRPIMGE